MLNMVNMHCVACLCTDLEKQPPDVYVYSLLPFVQPQTRLHPCPAACPATTPASHLAVRPSLALKHTDFPMNTAPQEPSNTQLHFIVCYLPHTVK